MKTLSIGGSRGLDNRGRHAFKHKLEADLTDLVKERTVSTKTADAQAAIAGLCAPQGRQVKEGSGEV